MRREVVLAGLCVWIGATLLLGNWRRISRPSLTERLRPYHPVGRTTPTSADILSVASLADVLGPLARQFGDALAAVFGTRDGVDARLRRIHSDLDPTAFRLRQLATSATGVVLGLILAVSGVPPALSVLVLAGAPLLIFLVVEQRLVAASERWQERLRSELPVVAEQLAMLLGAGFSLGSALNRVAERNSGCSGRDLRLVANRIRHGLTERAALTEWAETARVEQVDRLVSVLTIESGGGDLGRLVSLEARQARRDLHRRTLETLERRGQQVWIPVTVATLVPGVIFLAIPFIAALRLFSTT